MNEETINELMHENSSIFLQDVFLTCPINGDKGFIDRMEKDHFIVKCAETRWKISYKIEEC